VPSLRGGRWISVGRLDVATTGLLLLTNDGELANRLMHPSTGLDREYAVRTNVLLDDEQLEVVKKGVESDGETLRFADIRYFDGRGAGAPTTGITLCCSRVKIMRFGACLRA